MLNKSQDNNEIDLKRKSIDDPINKMNNSKTKQSKKKKINNNDAVVGGQLTNKKKKTIEELRAERLKRENEEKIKTQRLLNGPSSTAPIQLDDRKRRYNSQFNPDLARY